MHTRAGFVAPPGWADPSPREFQALTGVESIGVALDLGDFDWSLDRIGATEPQQVEAAQRLVERGATVVANVGTPFGWAGLGAGEGPHDRNARIAAQCGVPVVSAVSGVVDWLHDLGAARIALAATYYEDRWRDEWARIMGTAGFTVTRAASMADLGIVPGPLDATDPTHWAPTPDQIEATVLGVLAAAPADAIVVGGAGARTLACHRRLRNIAGVPVVAADTGLYRAICMAVGLELPAVLIDLL